MAETEKDGIAESFIIGNTRVKISDTYCRDRSAGEAEAILKHIAWQALQVINVKEPSEKP